MGGDATWFSDDITEFLPLMGMPKASKLWLPSGKLEVYIPGPEFILALKLLSSREKDRNDIRVLCKMVGIKKRNQAEAFLQEHVSEDIREEYTEKINVVLSKVFRK